MWQELPPKDPYGGYKGLHVGFKAINFPKDTGREFTSRKWEYVKIEYDPETNMLRLSKSEQYKGYRITKHRTITANIMRHMPEGRYICFDEESKDHMDFIWYGSI